MRAASVSHLRMRRSRSGRNLLVGLAFLAAGLLAFVLTPVRAEAEGPAASVSLRPLSGTLLSGTAQQVSTLAPDRLSVTFAGFVYPGEDGRLPSYVRAMGRTAAGEAVNCGTVRVTKLDNGLGFYRLAVVSGDVRDGCPQLGDQVAFRLLYGRVDDGVEAIGNRDATFAPGNTATVSLTPASESTADAAGGWAGETGGTVAVLTWQGASDVAIGDALALLERPVVRAWRWDASAQRLLVYVTGRPDFLQTLTTVAAGDVVSVRFQ